MMYLIHEQTINRHAVVVPTWTFPWALVMMSMLSPFCLYSRMQALYLDVRINSRSLLSPWTNVKKQTQQESLHTKQDSFSVKSNKAELSQWNEAVINSVIHYRLLYTWSDSSYNSPQHAPLAWTAPWQQFFHTCPLPWRAWAPLQWPHRSPTVCFWLWADWGPPPTWSDLWTHGNLTFIHSSYIKFTWGNKEVEIQITN